MKVTAIIPAAGSGTRMGKAKQYLEIAGRSLLERTLFTLAGSEVIAGIIIVVPADDVKKVNNNLKKSGRFPKILAVVAGGETRADSVRNGVMQATTEYVLVHDAARPFLTKALISKTVSAAEKFGAATAAVPIHDTVKLKDGDYLGGTADRSSLLSIQTPQVFQRPDLLAAYDRVGEKRREFTDETSLAQAAGLKVAWVEGEKTNIKVTTPDDVRLAEAIAEFLR